MSIEEKEKAEEEKEIAQRVDNIIKSTLYPDGKGYKKESFMDNYNKIAKFQANFLSCLCKQCGQVCRDCVKLVPNKSNKFKNANNDNNDEIICCEVCSVDYPTGNKGKFVAYTKKRRTVLKLNVIALEQNDDGSGPVLSNQYKFTGPLKKLMNVHYPKIIREQIEQEKEAKLYKILNAEKGIIKNLNWRFSDKSGADLFMISDDGLTAKTNKRTGTVLFGLYFQGKIYKHLATSSKRKLVNNMDIVGNIYEFELKIDEAEKCGICLIEEYFGQFTGKNEGGNRSMCIAQDGWFYTSIEFKHPTFEHSKETTMGNNWFLSNDVIVIKLDYSNIDAKTAKVLIYNKSKPNNKFEIDVFKRKKICIGVNVVVGSNPSGTKNPSVTMVKQTVVRV